MKNSGGELKSTMSNQDPMTNHIPSPIHALEGKTFTPFETWFYSLADLGSEIYSEAIQPSEIHRYVVLALPDKAFSLSAICLGIIAEHLKPLQFKIDPIPKLSINEIRQGMKVSGYINKKKFIALVKSDFHTSKIPGAITLQVNSETRNYGAKFMHDLSIISHESEDDYGYFPDSEETQKSYWPIASSLGELDTRFFSKPIVQILGSRSGIEEEWGQVIKWISNNDERIGTFYNVTCPFDEKLQPPYFTYLTTQAREMISEDAQEFKIDILSSFNAIKARLDSPVSSFSLILIGRSDSRARSIGNLIESRFTSSLVYEPEFKSLEVLPAVELLSFGIRK